MECTHKVRLIARRRKRDFTARGTFTNVPDGATITSGGNTYKANYEGGDGNDLALTVQS